MTIGAGFICTDGIVLAADTKEVYSGSDEHTYVHKLEVIDSTQCSGAIAGSGCSYPVDYITAKIKCLFDEGQYLTINECEAALVSLMTLIYQSKAMKAFPRDSASELGTSFLVAVRPKKGDGEVGMFVANSSLVTRLRDGVRVIGYGTMQNMADEIARLRLSIQQAKSAALYLIYETKRRTNWVGGLTHIFTLENTGKVQPDRTWDQARREVLFDELRGLHHHLVVAVSNPYLKPWEYHDAMREIQIAARSVRGEFRRIETKYQQWVAEQDGKFLESLSIKKSVS
jgi:20S proteasome alpha/beta subunit